jgi:hypothetical protein
MGTNRTAPEGSEKSVSQSDRFTPQKRISGTHSKKSVRRLQART